jgi:hypothetical protein
VTEVVILTALNTTSWRLRHVVQDAHSRTQSVSNEPGVKRVITMVRLAGWLVAVGSRPRAPSNCLVWPQTVLPSVRDALRKLVILQVARACGAVASVMCENEWLRRQIGLHVVLVPAIAVQIMLLVHFSQTDNRADNWEPVCRGCR